MLLLALVGCVSAYYVGRCLAGVRGGLLVVTLLVTPTIVEDEAVRIRGVFPSVALSLLSIALAFMAVRRKGLVGLVFAALSGSALAAAVSVKLLAVTAAAPVLAVLLRRKALRLSAALAAGAAAVVGAVLIVYADVLGPLWNDVVRFHLDAQSARIQDAPTSIGGNIAKVASASTDFSGLRSPFLWLVIIGAVGTLLAWRRRQLLGAAPLWVWAVVSALFLIWHRPLWAHDVVILIVALAVAAGVGLAPLLSGPHRGLAAIAAVLVFVAAASIAHHVQRTSDTERSAIKWAAAVLERRTRRGSEIASDLPIIPYLADRRQPGALVDTSRTRFGAASLTRAEILKSIDRDRVSAVVAGHLFAADPNLLQALHNRFPIVVRRTGVDLGEGPVDLRIYLRR
jgi:hypothetical protein